MLKQITENVFLFEDTCFVYIIRNHDQAVLVDFGSGEVCKELAGLGIKKVEAVLLTHHHRPASGAFRNRREVSCLCAPCGAGAH